MFNVVTESKRLFLITYNCILQDRYWQVAGLAPTHIFVDTVPTEHTCSLTLLLSYTRLCMTDPEQPTV